MAVRLSCSNFFKYYVIHPRSDDLSKSERRKALVCSIAVALLFGIPHIIARVKNYKSPAQKNPDHNKEISNTATSSISSSTSPLVKVHDKSKQADADQASLPKAHTFLQLQELLKARLDLTAQHMKEQLLLSAHYDHVGVLMNGVGFSRIVSTIKDSEQNAVLMVKIPKIKQQQAFTMKHDALAYYIDSVFNFGVVPPTMLVGKKSPIDTSFIETSEPLFYRRPLLLQIPVAYEVSQQIHLKKGFDKNALDSRQIQKAILYNIITGKRDGRSANTIVDKNNRVFEVDNEQIGLWKTDSWMIAEYKDLVFDQDIIESVINTPEVLLASTFDFFETEHELKLEETLKENVINNFRKLCTFFEANGTENIQVSMI